MLVRLVTMWRILVLALAACATTQPPPVSRPPEKRTFESGSCKAQPPIGEPAEFTLRGVPGFTIAEPQTCRGSSYIRIERATGKRRLGIERIAGGGFGAGCMDLTKLDGCASINVGAFLAQVDLELKREGIETAGNGAGPCAPNLDGDYEGWNMATGVHDWKDVDRLVAKIAELMERYDLSGYIGASVYTIECVELA